MTDDDILDYSGGGRISVNVDKLVQTEGFRRQLEGVKAMTDKAAREAFDPAEIKRLITGLNILSEDSEDDVVSLTTNFAIMVRDALLTLLRLQATRDAAMAAEPDVQTYIKLLREPAFTNAFHLDVSDALESLALQLQAAQQREANAIMASNELAMSAERAMAGLIAERRAAQPREAECRKDAERYRWLCDEPMGQAFHDKRKFIQERFSVMGKGATDAYIDAALATQPTSKGETT